MSPCSHKTNSFKVIIPALVKNIVDDQDLPVKAGHLNAISATEIEVKLDTMLDTPLAVKIDPIKLQLQIPKKDGDDDEDNDAAFLELELPETKVDGETEVKFPNQVVKVKDEKDLTAWFNAFFDNAQTDLRVTARDLTSHLGALKYVVDLDKNIQVNGLTYLEGFSAIDMEFILPPDDKGDNIKGLLNIPNSGNLELGLQNPSFFMMAGDVKLGLVTLPDLVLKPGNNSADFKGQFYFDALVPNLPGILSSQGTGISEGVINLNCTGNSTVDGNGDPIPYLEGVLNNKHIPLKIPITDLLSDLMSAFMDGGSLGDLDLGGGGNSTGGGLLDGLTNVFGNSSLFEGMLDRFEDS